MRRFRPGTLMLLIVIAAIVVALVMERNRSARPEGQSPKHTLDKILMNVFRKRFAKSDGGGRPEAVGTPKSREGDGR